MPVEGMMKLKMGGFVQRLVAAIRWPEAKSCGSSGM